MCFNLQKTQMDDDGYVFFSATLSGLVNQIQGEFNLMPHFFTGNVTVYQQFDIINLNILI